MCSSDLRRGLLVERGATPKAPRGSDGDDAHHHHPGISSIGRFIIELFDDPGICPTASCVVARRHPTGFRRGLLVERGATQKPLAEATGMTRATTIRAFPQSGVS